jgi:drug/metabolite transporter (DMT)-like permease
MMSATPGRSARGELLILGSALVFSAAGYFVRLIQQVVWTVLFWRGLVGGLFIAGYIVWCHRGATLATIRSMGRIGLFAAACSTVATICFVNSLRQTTVADVAIINATAPFMTAALAWLSTGARERASTLLASLLTLLGVAVMFNAARLEGHLVGDLLAVAMTVLMSILMVVVRHHRHVSMLPAACLSAFATAIVMLPFAHPATAFGPHLIWFVGFGVQFGLGLLLLTVGTRLISATRSALIGALEVPLAGVWVWAAFGEVPSRATCLGGAIVMLAVVGDLALGRLGDGGLDRSHVSAPPIGGRPATARRFTMRALRPRSATR